MNKSYLFPRVSAACRVFEFNCSLGKKPVMACRLEFQGCIREYHVCQSIRSGSSSQVLACHREQHNRKDLFIVGAYEDATLVGHIPTSFLLCSLALFKA